MFPLFPGHAISADIMVLQEWSTGWVSAWRLEDVLRWLQERGTTLR